MTTNMIEFGFRDCVCGGFIDVADHDQNGIATCDNCGLKYEVSIDASFDDGMWRDRTTVRPLMALPA